MVSNDHWSIDRGQINLNYKRLLIRKSWKSLFKHFLDSFNFNAQIFLLFCSRNTEIVQYIFHHFHLFLFWYFIVTSTSSKVGANIFYSVTGCLFFFSISLHVFQYTKYFDYVSTTHYFFCIFYQHLLGTTQTLRRIVILVLLIISISFFSPIFSHSVYIFLFSFTYYFLLF